VLKGKMSAILKLHCYHSNSNDVIKDCSIYVVQFLSSNKKPLFKKLNLNHDLSYFKNCITLSNTVNSLIHYPANGVLQSYV
jgi:hypothetical protein